MLTADHLTFGYARHLPPVLSDVSIEIAPGEIVGLAGPSGTGKSTLARILAGYLAPQSGRLSLDGEPLPRSGLRPVQLLFQAPELAVNPRWTVRRILTEAHPHNEPQWSRVGVHAAWLDRFPHELSGGELQRVCVARAIGPDLRFLIADEISGMLDTITQAEIWGELRAYTAAAAVGILAISHDVRLLERIASRILTIENGRIAGGDLVAR